MICAIKLEGRGLQSQYIRRKITRVGEDGEVGFEGHLCINFRSSNGKIPKEKQVPCIQPFLTTTHTLPAPPTPPRLPSFFRLWRLEYRKSWRPCTQTYICQDEDRENKRFVSPQVAGSFLKTALPDSSSRAPFVTHTTRARQRGAPRVASLSGSAGGASAAFSSPHPHRSPSGTARPAPFPRRAGSLRRR